MSHEPRQESTESDERAESGLPTDQGAREALVEQLAEAILLADDDWERDPVHATGTWDSYLARAVLPLLAAQVEAAVSVVRAEVERANQHADEWAATADRWTHRAAENGRRAGSAEADLRALREGLEALADHWANDPHALAGIGNVGEVAAHDLRALLAPSPAETEDKDQS